MDVSPAQVWKATPFTIERQLGKAAGTVIFRLHGPFTARDMFGTMTPVALHDLLGFQATPGDETPALHILDLTNVPYMDSTGLGKVVGHFVHCRGKGVKMVAAGASPRVVELFKMTKVDSVIPTTATVEEAEM